MWDAWYMDDGQVILPPHVVATYLTTFDAELAACGGTRVADGKFKSAARLIGSAEACAAVQPTWSAGIVERTCQLDAAAGAGPHGKVLGVELDGECLQEQMRAAIEQTERI